MKITTQTHQGMVRTSNQDAVAGGKWSENEAWAIVCDGMGGANGGNIASDLCVKTLVRQIQNYQGGLRQESIFQFLNMCYYNANLEIYKASCEDKQLAGMGTTADTVLVLHNNVYIAHVGDSCVYKITDNEITKVTTDHTYVQELVDSGSISTEEAKKHPQKHVITRAVGVLPSVEFDFYQDDFSEDTSYLLCSDGLTNLVPEQEIQKIVMQNPAEKAVNLLIEEANRLGGFDNVTVAIISN